MFPLILLLLNLGHNAQLQSLFSQLVNALCLSEIVIEASFPSVESPSCAILTSDVQNTPKS